MERSRSADRPWSPPFAAAVLAGLIAAGCGLAPSGAASPTTNPSGAAGPATGATSTQATGRPHGSPDNGSAGPGGTTGPADGTSGGASPGSSPLAYPADRWSRLVDAPVALTEVAATGHQGRVWVAGGLRSTGVAEDRVFVFDPAAGRWSDGPRLPEGVHHASFVSTGADLYLLGGYLGALSGAPTAAVRRLEIGGARWIEGPPLPAARGAGAAAWDGARIVFAGGVSPSGVSREVWALEGGGWRLIGPLARAREHLAATSDGRGQTWFLGGRARSLSANVGTVEVVEGGRIRSIEASLTPRSGVAAFWTPAAGACLAGGEGPSGTHAEVECVSLDGRVVAQPRLGVARHGLGAAVIGGVAYVVLGGERPGLFVSPVVEALAIAAS